MWLNLNFWTMNQHVTTHESAFFVFLFWWAFVIYLSGNTPMFFCSVKALKLKPTKLFFFFFFSPTAKRSCVLSTGSGRSACMLLTPLDSRHIRRTTRGGRKRRKAIRRYELSLNVISWLIWMKIWVFFIAKHTELNKKFLIMNLAEKTINL